MKTLLATVAACAVLAGVAQASPLAVAAAEATASQINAPSTTQRVEQGQGQGQNQGQRQGQRSSNRNSTSTSSDNSTKDNSWAVAAALGQAPTAATGPCAGGFKIAFGLLEFTRTLENECMFALGSDAMRMGLPNTAAQIIEAAYNGEDTVDLRQAALQDFELKQAREVALIQAAKEPAEDLTWLANDMQEVKARLGAIKSSWENENYGSPAHRRKK